MHNNHASEELMSCHKVFPLRLRAENLSKITSPLWRNEFTIDQEKNLMAKTNSKRGKAFPVCGETRLWFLAILWAKQLIWWPPHLGSSRLFLLPGCRDISKDCNTGYYTCLVLWFYRARLVTKWFTVIHIGGDNLATRRCPGPQLHDTRLLSKPYQILRFQGAFRIWNYDNITELKRKLWKV